MSPNVPATQRFWRPTFRKRGGNCSPSPCMVETICDSISDQRAITLSASGKRNESVGEKRDRAIKGSLQRFCAFLQPVALQNNTDAPCAPERSPRTSAGRTPNRSMPHSTAADATMTTARSDTAAALPHRVMLNAICNIFGK